MQYRLAYGKTGLTIDLPDHLRATVVQPRHAPGLPDPVDAVREALDRPIGTPPLRKGTRAAFGVYAYAGELTVSLRTDPHCFAPEDSARLLALYVKQLEGFA